jgi:hypothetical protein
MALTLRTASCKTASRAKAVAAEYPASVFLTMSEIPHAYLIREANRVPFFKKSGKCPDARVNTALENKKNFKMRLRKLQLIDFVHKFAANSKT